MRWSVVRCLALSGALAAKGGFQAHFRWARVVDNTKKQHYCSSSQRTSWRAKSMSGVTIPRKGRHTVSSLHHNPSVGPRQKLLTNKQAMARSEHPSPFPIPTIPSQWEHANQMSIQQAAFSALVKSGSFAFRASHWSALRLMPVFPGSNSPSCREKMLSRRVKCAIPMLPLMLDPTTIQRTVWSHILALFLFDNQEKQYSLRA